MVRGLKDLLIKHLRSIFLSGFLDAFLCVCHPALKYTAKQKGKQQQQQLCLNTQRIVHKF